MVKKIESSDVESTGHNTVTNSQAIDTTVGGQMKTINGQNQIVYLGANNLQSTTDQGNTVTVAKKTTYPPGTQGTYSIYTFTTSIMKYSFLYFIV